jgi:flagellar biosynthesis/type III secretory pathway protein FliH
VNESIGYEPKPKENDIEQELEDQEERASFAASNILGFIEKRLRADVADGASKEQLESRLNAALEGFEKGYKEANQILDDLNLITPSLEDEIALTKEKVMAGLGELTDEFIAEPSQLIKPDSVQQDLSNLAPLEGTQYAQVEAGEARDFSFSLTTRDGDQVRKCFIHQCVSSSADTIFQ